MKRHPTKAEKRALLNREIEAFLQSGGQVDEVPQGVSGRENPEQALLPVLFSEKAMERTDATKALNSLDQRKKQNHTSTQKKKRPKKKPIYDDFGELLRWVWED